MTDLPNPPAAPWLVLPAELTIYTAAETRARWLAALDALPADAEAGADGAAVDQVDTAGVQLLVALARSLRQRGQPLRLATPSAVLAEALGALGVALPTAPEGAPA